MPFPAAVMQMDMHMVMVVVAGRSAFACVWEATCLVHCINEAAKASFTTV
jgi:hypothetical protein